MCKLDKQQQCARRKGVGVGSKRVPSPEPGEFPPHVLKQFEIDARAGVKRCPLCMQLTQFYVGSDQDGMYSQCCHVTAAGCQVFSTQEETRTFATQDHGDANKNQARKRVELYTDEHDREMCLITDNPKAEMRLNQVLVWRQFVRNSPPGHVSLTDAQCKRLAILARAACLQWAKLDESKLDETKDEDVEALQAWEEFKGSPVFWFIVLVQQVIAESGSDFNVPTEELAHMLSMDAIHEYLSAFKSTRVHTAEKLGNATRAKGAAAQAAYLAADDKTRLARFDPLGDTDFKRINKIKFLDELLQGSGVMKKGLDRCGALHARILSAKPPRVVKDASLRHKPLWEKTVKLKPIVTGLQLANETETRERVLSNAASERVAEAKRIAELERCAFAAMARVANYEAHKKAEAQTAAATEAEVEQDVTTTSGEDSDDDDELSKMDLESEGAHEDYDADEDAMDPDDPLAAKVTIEKMGLTPEEELAELEREERELERKLDPSYDSEEDEEHENEEEEEPLAPLPRLEPVVVKTKDGEQTLVMEEDESDTDDEGEGEGATTACADKSVRASGGAPQKRSAPRSGVGSTADPAVRSGRALDELISAGRYDEITAAEWATVGVRARPKTTKSIPDHKLRRATNAEIKNAPDPVRAWIERAARRAAHKQKSQDVQNRRKAKELAKEDRKAIRKKTREQRLVDIQRLKEERRHARELLADQRCENRVKKIQPMRAGTVAVPIHADDIKPGTFPIKFRQFGAKHTFTEKKQKEIKEILNGERKITVNWVQCDTCRLWRMLPETHPGWPEDQFFFCQQINRTCGKRDPLDSEGKKEKKQKQK
tara:strand:+ start:880 stop:3369 length:2490 start_codon:yes stop_codon:yes gene_type:complete